MKQPEDFIAQYAKDNECDVFVLNGDINDTLYETALKHIFSKEKFATKLHLFINSLGGDANSAYRFINLLQSKYNNNVEAIIVSKAKSAATLLCLGTNKIIFNYAAELGPLDVQIRSYETPGRVRSGLITAGAINQLMGMSVNVIDRFIWLMLQRTTGIGLLDLLERGTALSSSLLAPIAKQIDPHMAAEHEMSLSIASEYGKRLLKRYHFASNYNENTCGAIINNLVNGYPDHSFVIDYNEAKDLSLNIAYAENHQAMVCNMLSIILKENQMYGFWDILFPKKTVIVEKNKEEDKSVILDPAVIQDTSDSIQGDKDDERKEKVIN